MNFFSVLFDLDGVISDTATIHSKAWKTVLERTIKTHNKSQMPFIMTKDYPKHLDGKTRYAGIKSFLKSRGIKVPVGKVLDKGYNSIIGISNEKYTIFRNVLEQDGLSIFQDAIRLMQKLETLGAEMGLASSSKNARAILEQADLAKRFKYILDGVIAEKHGIASKPDPEFYLHAAELMGRKPQECVVLEDAISGVISAQRAGIKTVIGVARKNNANILIDNGADITVSSIDELNMDIFNIATK